MSTSIKRKADDQLPSECRKRFMQNIHQLQPKNDTNPTYSTSALSSTTKAAITQKPDELLDNIMQNNWKLSPISNLTVSRLFKRKKPIEQSDSEESEDSPAKKPRASLAAAFSKISRVPSVRPVLVSKTLPEDNYSVRRLDYDPVQMNQDLALYNSLKEKLLKAVGIRLLRIAAEKHGHLTPCKPYAAPTNFREKRIKFESKVNAELEMQMARGRDYVK